MRNRMSICFLLLLISSTVFGLIGCDKKTLDIPVSDTDTHIRDTSEDQKETAPFSENTTVPPTTTATAPTTTTKAPAVTAHSHSYVKTASATATCTAEGSETFTCSCGDRYTNKVKALGHLYTKWNVTVEATTTSTGTKECKCDRCGGAPIYETIPVKIDTSGIDPRIEVVKVTNFGTPYTKYMYGKCTVADRRTWGSITEISVVDNMNLHVVYYNQNNERVEFNVSTPYSNYRATCIIKDDGTYVINLTGSYS